MILCLWSTPPPLIKVASNRRPYSKLGGTTLNGREEGGQYYISQTCDQERFAAGKVVFSWECLNIFATGCSKSYRGAKTEGATNNFSFFLSVTEERITIDRQMPCWLIYSLELVWNKTQLEIRSATEYNNVRWLPNVSRKHVLQMFYGPINHETFPHPLTRIHFWEAWTEFGEWLHV